MEKGDVTYFNGDDVVQGTQFLGAFLYYCYGAILYFLWFREQYNGVACREWSKIVVKILNRAQFCEKYKFSP